MLLSLFLEDFSFDFGDLDLDFDLHSKHKTDNRWLMMSDESMSKLKERCFDQKKDKPRHLNVIFYAFFYGLAEISKSLQLFCSLFFVQKRPEIQKDTKS